MDFTITPEIEELRLRTRDFINEHVIPLESEPANYDQYENIRLDLLETLRKKAKQTGLWAPQSPKEFGGMGLPIIAWAVMYEEANRSIFGPNALNCQAPDDGNMNVLARVGSPAETHRRRQRALFLRDDRTASRRRLRSLDDPHQGGKARRQMDRNRTQMVHLGRSRGLAFHPHRANG
jgi:acyl-CoA dehydrogenase